MPLYEYQCRECKHVFKEMKSMADRDLPLSEPCPSCGVQVEDNIYQVLGAPPILDPVKLGRKKPESGFNEVLKNIKKGNPGSTINIRD